MYKEIEVFSQAELDAIPQDFHGRILIKFGTRNNLAHLNRAWDNATAVLWDNASAELWENASAELWDNASAELWDNASAVLGGNASAELRGHASAELWDNASAVLWNNASADAAGNAQVVAASNRAKIKTSGNARIVYNPKTPEEYAEHNGLECRDGVMVLYKAVHKRGGSYYSDRDDDFEYKIGETVIPEYPLDTDPMENCGSGIHAAHKAWCVDYGRGWDDLAVLEVEMPMASMVVPINGSGKVRADWARVLREVPLEECGLLGKMLAKRRENGRIG